MDYDVAQKRERIAIVGIRNDLVEKYNVSYAFPKPYGYILTLRDVLQNVPKSDGDKYPESKRKVLELVPPGGYWRICRKILLKHIWVKAITLGWKNGYGKKNVMG